ncbi:MAG: WYL domain-containing protein [Deltaproteobacteria bacterium]|nr:WYL domain-containing protein [Deltaproteobacteria bacterium]
MGRRSGTETVVRVLAAFLGQRTWSQANLAAEVGVGVPALRRVLLELETEGVPFSRDDEHPHVFWSVPASWFPGGLVLSRDDVADLMRLLARLPRTRARSRLLDRVRQAAPVSRAPVVLAPDPSPGEEAFLAVVEDAASKEVALRFRYFSASRGALEWRHASAHKVQVGPPARFVATCHRSASLKWFRVDNILGADLDPHEAFRGASEATVREFIATSIGGYTSGQPIECRFFVRDPEARWVKGSLPEGSRFEVVTVPAPGIRVTARTGGVVALARHVVGLGDAARVETPELRAIVRDLAEGALRG